MLRKRKIESFLFPFVFFLAILMFYKFSSLFFILFIFIVAIFYNVQLLIKKVQTIFYMYFHNKYCFVGCCTFRHTMVVLVQKCLTTSILYVFSFCILFILGCIFYHTIVACFWKCTANSQKKCSLSYICIFQKRTVVWLFAGCSSGHIIRHLNRNV